MSVYAYQFLDVSFFTCAQRERLSNIQYVVMSYLFLECDNVYVPSYNKVGIHQ